MKRIGIVLTVIAFASAVHLPPPAWAQDVNGCSPASWLSTPGAGDSRGLALFACPLADTVVAGESIPVLVLLQNRRSHATRINSYLALGTWLRAEVVRADGNEMQIGEMIEPGLGAYTLSTTLPPTGFIGRNVDLTCAVNDYSVPVGQGNCVDLYSLSEPGEYSVTFHFNYLCEGTGCEGREYDLNTVRAEPFKIWLR